MLDLNFVSENLDLVSESSNNRGLEIDLSANPGYRGSMTQVKLCLPSGAGAATVYAVALERGDAEQGNGRTAPFPR